ncbi:MAG: hypothetical protein AB7V43_16575, partial [Acidimicrobiia bacterium]
REAERNIANGDATDKEIDRRLARAESEGNRTSERNREYGARIDSLSTQMTAMTQSLQSDHERHWQILDEQITALTRRGTEDRVQLEQLIEEVRRSANQRAARIEQLVGALTSRLDAGSDDTAGRVHALAHEMARLSIDLRSELAQALAKATRQMEAQHAAVASEQVLIDLTEPQASSVDLL